MVNIMDKKQEYIEMYNYIKSSPSGYFSSLASKADESLNLVSTQINQIIEKLGASDTWDDSISWTINQTTGIGIPEMIKACQEPAIAATRKIDSILDSLKTSLNKYDLLVDEYNELDSELKKSYSSVPERTIKEYFMDENGNFEYDENGNKKIKSETTNIDYINYTNTQAKLDDLKKDIDSYIDLIDNEYDQLKGILSEVGTDAFATANGIAIGNGEIKNSSSFAIEYGYDDEYFTEECVQYDENGQVVSIAYRVLDKDGNVVENGICEYDENHRIKKVKKDIIPADPTKLDADDGIAEVLDAVAENETHEVDIEFSDGDDATRTDEFKETYTNDDEIVGVDTFNGTVNDKGTPIDGNGVVDATYTSHDGNEIKVDENYTLEEGKKIVDCVALSDIPTEIQEKTSNECLEKVSEDTEIIIDENQEYSATLADNGNINVTMSSADKVEINETDRGLESTFTTSTSKSVEVTDNSGNSVGGIQTSTGGIDLEISYSLSSDGTTGCMKHESGSFGYEIVPEEDTYGCITYKEYTVDYDPGTGVERSRVLQNSDVGDSTVTYEIPYLDSDNKPTGEYKTITVNPKSETGKYVIKYTMMECCGMSEDLGNYYAESAQYGNDTLNNNFNSNYHFKLNISDY